MESFPYSMSRSPILEGASRGLECPLCLEWLAVVGRHATEAMFLDANMTRQIHVNSCSDASVHACTYVNACLLTRADHSGQRLGAVG